MAIVVTLPHWKVTPESRSKTLGGRRHKQVADSTLAKILNRLVQHDSVHHKMISDWVAMSELTKRERAQRLRNLKTPETVKYYALPGSTPPIVPAPHPNPTPFSPTDPPVLQVKNKMVVHMDARSKQMLALKRENAELRARVEHLESMMALGGPGTGPRNGPSTGLGEETNSNGTSSSSSLGSKANSARTAVSTPPGPKSPPPVPPRPVTPLRPVT